jgi:hypothetical protein
MKIWALVAGFLVVAAPALAQVPDCMTESYIARFQVAGLRN